MKTIELNVYGRICHLRLTSAALYDIYEHFGKEVSVFDNISGNDKAAFDAVCWYLAKLSEQGELARRWEGHEAMEFLTEADFRTIMTPKDFPAAKLAVIRALNQGFGREIEDDEPVDLVLLELQKKTAKPEAEPDSAKPPRSFLGFPFRTRTS